MTEEFRLIFWVFWLPLFLTSAVIYGLEFGVGANTWSKRLVAMFKSVSFSIFGMALALLMGWSMSKLEERQREDREAGCRAGSPLYDNCPSQEQYEEWDKP